MSMEVRGNECARQHACLRAKQPMFSSCAQCVRACGGPEPPALAPARHEKLCELTHLNSPRTPAQFLAAGADSPLLWYACNTTCTQSPWEVVCWDGAALAKACCACCKPEPRLDVALARRIAVHAKTHEPIA